MKTRAEGYRAEQRFSVRFAVALVAIIVLGFGQFGLRGLSNPFTAPVWVHLHGGLMLVWLGLFVAQSMLAQGRSLALHRRIGWLSTGVLAAIVATGLYTGYRAVELGRVPPFFSDAYFLALSTLGTLSFAAVVIWAIVLRLQTDWHRRLMLGSGIVLMEPALGRLLPMPLLGAWGGLAELVAQLCFVTVLARHDVKLRGTVHPATLGVALALIATHGTITLLSLSPAFAAYAASVAGSA